MTDKKAQAAPKSETPSGEVDRIRDIIFGSQIRDYEQRFQTLQQDVNRLQQDLDRVTDQLADQNSEQGNKLADLHQEMRQADENLREELRQKAQQLNTDKVDRISLGELFIEIGSHLKTGGGSLLSDMLTQLQDHSEAE